jgi:hypothetical protein
LKDKIINTIQIINKFRSRYIDESSWLLHGSGFLHTFRN